MSSTSCIAECPNCKARSLVKITLNALEPKQPPRPPAVRVVPPRPRPNSRSRSPIAPPPEKKKEAAASSSQGIELKEPESEGPPAEKHKTKGDVPRKTKKDDAEAGAKKKATNDEDDSSESEAWEFAGCKEKTRYRMYQSRTKQCYCKECARENELATAPPRKIE